eukprot:scaffold26519_cov56-Phaeocystis_antarctica.AAC.1
MSRSQRRRGRGALCERGASVCTESEGQERLDREQVTRDGVRWPVVMRRLRYGRHRLVARLRTRCDFYPAAGWEVLMGCRQSNRCLRYDAAFCRPFRGSKPRCSGKFQLNSPQSDDTSWCSSRSVP